MQQDLGSTARRRSSSLLRIGRRALLAVSIVAGAVSILGVASAAATPPAGTTTACNYYYQWSGTVGLPVQPDPHATYSYVMPSSQAGVDGIGFVVHGQFQHVAWNSWTAYTGKSVPYSVANFVNNSPANTYNPIQPDAGSGSPFAIGQPMLGTGLFTLLFKPAGYTGTVAASLGGISTASINRANIKPYPTKGHGSDSNFWMLVDQTYQKFSGLGYNPAGTTMSTFPTVTAVSLATGAPVDCQKYNVIPDQYQATPVNPPASLNFGTTPTKITLKNGSKFTPAGDLGSAGGGSRFAPRNPKNRVVFTRPPIGPGADVSSLPQTQRCADYLGTASSTSKLELIRIPHIANYTDNSTVTAKTTWPNPHDPGPWQAAYESYVQYGTSSGAYHPETLDNSAMSDGEFSPDTSEGSTIISWPRNLSASAQAQVLAYAKSHDWAIVRSGTAGKKSTATALIRIKGSASNYTGNLTRVPCYYGTPKKPTHSGAKWNKVPVAKGSKYVASIANMYIKTKTGKVSAAPQGVICPSLKNLTTGGCLASLKKYLTSTGARYSSTG
jgi:hypothetical protein